jgi:tetratricopeptide (TPR) repeat protein
MKKTRAKKAGPTSRRAQPGKATDAKRPATGSKSSSSHTSKGRSRPPGPPPFATRQPTADEVAHQHHMERFENALQLFNQNQTSRARAMFERLIAIPSPELAERAKVYVSICDQRLSRATVELKTAEDFYNYAVGLANEGNAEGAEEYLHKALKLSPNADHLYYALATTYALRDDVEGALEHLLKAIELNERNRFQAQHDSDFANLLEDPRFTELLYPEKPLT